VETRLLDHEIHVPLKRAGGRTAHGPRPLEGVTSIQVPRRSERVSTAESARFRLF
jgi:hypothetical protein